MVTFVRGGLAALLASQVALGPLAARAADTTLSGTPGAAPATGKRKLAVVELGSPPMMIGIAGKITKLVSDEAAREGSYEIVDPAQVRAALGDDKVRLLQGCLGRADCLAAAAEPLGVDRLVTGMIDKTSDTYVVRLWLVDVPNRAVVSSVDRRILIASRRLERDVAEAIPALLKGEAEATGKAVITVTDGVDGADVTIDGEPAGRAPLTWTGKPGKHTLKVERPGYYPVVDRFFNIDAGAEAQVEVKLVLVPGAKPPPVVARKEEAPQEKEGEGTLRLPVAAWIAAGLATVAAGGGIYFGATAAGIESDAAPGDDGVLQITREDALAGQRDATIANVLFGISGTALLAAVAVTVFFPDRPTAGASPAPAARVSASPSGVAVSGSF